MGHLRVAGHVEGGAGGRAGLRRGAGARRHSRRHRADGVERRGVRRAGPAQQRHPQLVGPQPPGLPGVDVDAGEVVALAGDRAPLQVPVAGGPPAQHVPARGPAGRVAPADPDLDPAVAGRGRRPRRDQAGEVEAWGDPRGVPVRRVVAAAVDVAAAVGPLDQQSSLADPDARQRALPPLLAGVPLGEGDLPRGTRGRLGRGGRGDGDGGQRGRHDGGERDDRGEAHRPTISHTSPMRHISLGARFGAGGGSAPRLTL